MIKITDKHLLRKRILEVCIQKQKSLIDDFNQRIKTLLDAQGLGNKDEYDNNEMSQKGQATQEVNALYEALSLATEEMNFLQQLKKTERDVHKIAGPGAIVITDKTVFFISVSIEQFDVDGESFFGISTKSPVYAAMKGLTKGSLFLHNRLSYKIIDIF